MRKLYTYILLTLLFPLAAYSQTTDRNYSAKKENLKAEETETKWLLKDETHVHEFSVWGGYAFDSFKLWGKTPDATIGQFGLAYNRKFLKIGNQLFKYRFSVNLFSKLSYPQFEPERDRTSLSGFGVTPFGLRVNFRQNRTIKPFFDSAGGLLLFNEPFPDGRGKKFNYTFGLGAGVEVPFNSGSSFSLGYKYFHISNGESGQINPGVDSGFFFLAITFY